MTDNTYQKGLAGESQAILFLQEQGMQLVRRRYRSTVGEIDVIMLDGDTLVFVEVKLRLGGKRGDGLMAIGKGKQRRIIQTALFYLAENDHDGSVRFDVVELTEDGVCYVKNAFEGKEY